MQKPKERRSITFSSSKSWKFDVWSRGTTQISKGNEAAKGTTEKKCADSLIKMSSDRASHKPHFPVRSKSSFMLLSLVETEGGTTGSPIIWLCEWVSDAPADTPWFLNTFYALWKKQKKKKSAPDIWSSNKIYLVKKKYILTNHGQQKE